MKAKRHVFLSLHTYFSLHLERVLFSSVQSDIFPAANREKETEIEKQNRNYTYTSYLFMCSLMAIAATASISLEGGCCSPCYAVATSWIKPPPCDAQRFPDLTNLSFRCKSSFLGGTHIHSSGHSHCLQRVAIAADYSDSLPDSSNYTGNSGYHPLEDVKVCKKARDTKLTSAEIARTTLEANSSACLVFPGIGHSEPHEQISWVESQYVIDDYGDIFFEIFDDVNILQNRGGSNPVTALVGIDIPVYESRRIDSEYISPESYSDDDLILDDDYLEVLDPELTDIPVDWGMPHDSSWIHPLYFAKCMSKAITMEHCKTMDCPSNGVSVVGCLRPAFVDEVPYLRRLFVEESDGYISDWKDDEVLTAGSTADERLRSSTLYRLEIMRIELFSAYGIQSVISVPDFQDAEPDVLVHSTSEILERFHENGTRCTNALKALCKKKGLRIERANLIGVDSLGMDVRVSCGSEVQTHRFPFKVRATTETAAEKQMHQLLFPRSRRKKFNNQVDQLKDPY